VSVRIVPLAAAGDPTGLQPLAEAIFGAGDRRPDWFARKLVRECVDPEPPRLAIDDELGPPGDPRAWLGYVLVGTPPSRQPTARTAGTGVLAAARGRGLGTALVQAAMQACARAGYDALELWAEDGQESFYRRLGFVPVLLFETLLAFGRAPAGAPLELPPPLPWDAPPEPSDTPRLEPVEVQSFLAEAYERTPTAERGTVRITTPHGLAHAHLCREGRAIAIHRTLVPPYDPTSDALTLFDAVLARSPPQTPVVLVAIDRVSSITASLCNRDATAPWQPIQRGAIVRARL